MTERRPRVHHLRLNRTTTFFPRCTSNSAFAGSGGESISDNIKKQTDLEKRIQQRPFAVAETRPTRGDRSSLHVNSIPQENFSAATEPAPVHGTRSETSNWLDDVSK